MTTRLFSLPFPPDDPCPIPVYFDSFAPPAPATDKLEGDRQADVVIVTTSCARKRLEECG